MQDYDEIKLKRPEYLKNFVGQEVARKNLRVFMDAALAREESLDHVLFYGPPGLGKTSLAFIIARELGVSIKATSGPLITKAGDLAAMLTGLQAKDVLFIDEIHRLSTHVEEVLYSAMEDYSIDILVGKGPTAKTIKINIPPFTLVGATTRLGLLSNALIDRFGIQINLEFYTQEELIKIVLHATKMIEIGCKEDAAVEIVKRARGTPRIALRILKRVRDFAEVEKANIITLRLVQRVLGYLKIDNLGLDLPDIRYLDFIAKNYQDKPVGINTIAAALSEQRDNIEEIVEPYLIKIGFLRKTARGRLLTRKALLHLSRNSSKKDTPHTP